MRDDCLVHYGVKGMKWGVRNAETRARYSRESRQGRALERVAEKADAKAIQLESQGKAGPAKLARGISSSSRARAEVADIKNDRIKAAKYRNAMRLPASEIAERIDRLSKEKKLRELTATQVTPVRNEVLKLLKNSGTSVATTVTIGGVTYIVAKKVSGEDIRIPEMGVWLGRKMLKQKK